MSDTTTRPRGRPRQNDPACPLTGRQREILEAIYDVLCREGRRPTLQELAARFGLSGSPNAIACHVPGLAKKGYIRSRDAGTRANYDLLRLPSCEPFKGLRPVREGEEAGP